MRGWRASTSSVIFAIFIIVVLSTPTGAFAASPGRAVTVPIKIVLLGFDENQIDASYLTWAGDSKNLPGSITNVELLSDNATGVVFYPQYTVTFASHSFRQDFVRYLRSIEVQKNGNNPWFGKYEQDTENPDYWNRVPVAIDYVVYDAKSVEDWLWSHSSDLGGFPNNGWTIIVAYLPELPSVTWKDVQNFEKSNGGILPKSKPHYYGISRTDRDLGYTLRYRDFMNAWGGSNRMWFVDLSAGPVFQSQWVDLPLQVVLGDNNIDVTAPFGRTWLTEYISDYVWGATYNLVTPNFVYFPQLAAGYQIDVFILDDRTEEEKKAVSIESTVNKALIETAFKELLPYSEVTVNVQFPQVSEELHNVIQDSYKYTDSWIMGADFASPERYGVVDLRPVYKYMLDNFQLFERSGRYAHTANYGNFDPSMVGGTMTIPVFAFAFSGETYFTYTYKWFIGDTDWETGALLGIALPEAAFVSLNQWYFTRGDHVTPPQPGKGMGFTQTIIHEVGHEVGLMHPHEYDDLGDFVVSAMGYFTDDYVFGQIDKDALQRAHVDQLYLESLKMMDRISDSSAANQVRSRLAEVDSAYAEMRYADAVGSALAAYGLAKQAAGGPVQTQTQTETTTLPPPAAPGGTMVFLGLGVIVGVVVGVAVAMIINRARAGK